jgi:hypothetical protein
LALLFLVKTPEKKKGKKGGVDHDSLLRTVAESHRVWLVMVILHASVLMLFGGDSNRIVRSARIVGGVSALFPRRILLGPRLRLPSLLTDVVADERASTRRSRQYLRGWWRRREPLRIICIAVSSAAPRRLYNELVSTSVMIKSQG